jgi:hypothetical protein
LVTFALFLATDTFSWCVGDENKRRYAMTKRRLMIAILIGLCLAADVAAADVSGSWTVTITTASGTITGKASLTQTGPSEDPTISIEGVLTAAKLTLKTNPRRGRTAAFDSCEVTVSDDKMVGTIQGGDAGKGTIEFVRAKP